MIHEIVFHGKGGYDWYTVYNLPIWRRKFIFNKIKQFYDKEAEAYKSAQSPQNQTTVVDTSGKINTQEFMKANPKASFK